MEVSARMLSNRSREILFLAIPFLIYVSLVSSLGNWIIDDAGITYAYARNLALGYGLVSQPGLEPIEGYSNFLWLLVISPLFSLGIFDPYIIVKWLSALLVLWSFWIIGRTLRKHFKSDVPGIAVTCLLAISPPIVIWTSSGLENPLTLLLASALFASIAERAKSWQVEAGLLCGLLALNRPDGIIFASAPIFVLAGEFAVKKHPIKKILCDITVFIGCVLALYLPFLFFRLLYFGRLQPHTYYAKTIYPSFWAMIFNPILQPGAAISRLIELIEGTFGGKGLILSIVGAICFLWLIIKKRLTGIVWVSISLSIVAVLGYLIIDPDWMGEFRFGTAAIAYSLILLVLLVCEALNTFEWRYIRRAIIFLLAILIFFAGMDFIPRIRKYGANPATTFGFVAKNYAFKFNVYADILGLRSGSIFLPDIGGMLYYSRLRIYDAAGLCDPMIVKTLKKDTIYWFSDHPEFYDYIFEKIKPTFINTHDFWTYVTAFDKDPRFRRDYVPIVEWEDAYVKRQYGVSLFSGDFVRRDALRDTMDIVRLRFGYAPQIMPTDVYFKPDTFAIDNLLSKKGSDKDIEFKTGSLFSKALLSIEHGDMENAALFFRKFIDSSSDSIAASESVFMALKAYIVSSGEDSVDRIYSAGYIAQSLKYFDKALLFFDRIHLVLPSYKDSRFLAGWSKQALKKNKEAIEEYKLAIKYSPEIFNTYLNLGYAYLDLGDYEEAEKAFLKFLEKSPDNANAKWGLKEARKKKKEKSN